MQDPQLIPHDQKEKAHKMVGEWYESFKKHFPDEIHPKLILFCSVSLVGYMAVNFPKQHIDFFIEDFNKCLKETLNKLYKLAEKS